MSYSTLYKLDSKGKLRVWSVEVDDLEEIPLVKIKVKSGIFEGSIKTNVKVIDSGKNIGKINETTPLEQAHNEALSAWKKKKESGGYHEDKKLAESGQGDTVVRPMLASEYSKHKDNISFPVLTQPKLDGVRCIAVCNSEEGISLYTRTGKKITTMPHIIEDLAWLLQGQEYKELIFDGELYCHDLRDNFDKISSQVRKQSGKKSLSYHIYDLINSDLTQKERHDKLKVYLTTGSSCVKLVKSNVASDIEDIEIDYTNSIEDGYEGLMIRDLKSTYETKRSKNLLKYKCFDEQEFKILDYKTTKTLVDDEEIIKLNFVCESLEINSPTFEVPMMGSQSFIKRLLKNIPYNKQLTVKHFGFTDANQVPRFPIGKEIRNYE